MTSTDGSRFEVRDDDLADRPPLATAGGYRTALGDVDRLEAEFFDQLDANGEGAAGISLHLRIDRITTDHPATTAIPVLRRRPPLTHLRPRHANPNERAYWARRET